LRIVQAELPLASVSVEEAEMEKAPHGRFDLVTFRAFKPLEPKIYKKLCRLCAEGGCLAAYKGRREKIEAEMAVLEKAVPNIAGHWSITPCPVPFLDEERHLVVVSG
jgi:16S rRNA (guanine527-N7)-methyltransferase